MNEQESEYTKKKRKNELVGKGCFIQGLGLLAPILLFLLFGPGGLIAGLVLLVILLLVGSRLSVKWVCGSCRNPLPDKSVKMCPVCKKKFTN